MENEIWLIFFFFNFKSPQNTRIVTSIDEDDDDEEEFDDLDALRMAALQSLGSKV